MIHVAGIDVGAGTAKVVILRDNTVMSYSIVKVTDNVAKVAEIATEEALEKAGLSLQDLDYIVSTGYGRSAVSCANKVSSEIICHASGVYFLMKEARTIIDIGTQDSKVIKIDESGRIINFAMNDKCAAGTGRFLEVMASALGLKLDEMGPISLSSENPCSISSTCTVFAESEVITLRAQGRYVKDLVAGIHKGIATRVTIMGTEIGFEREIVFTGGVAKNSGVKKALEDVINMTILTPVEPQITGALGAALIAKAEFRSLRPESVVID
jgi:predicted CoA-substrate-specific enzyme activase